MSSDASCDSLTPVRDAAGEPSANVKRQGRSSTTGIDDWAGFFGRGGYLWDSIDAAKAVWPMAVWCFLTGYLSVISTPVQGTTWNMNSVKF